MTTADNQQTGRAPAGKRRPAALAHDMAQALSHHGAAAISAWVDWIYPVEERI